MSIVKTRAYFKSSDGENLCHVLIWKDDEKEPEAIVQISHGLTDHIGRYERLAGFLAQNGIVVCGNDHIGHGLTAKSKDTLGSFGEPDSDIRMLDDMHLLHNIMAKKYPNLPYFLLGQNMGSFLSKLYAARFGDELSGVILSGTTDFGGKLSSFSEYSYTLGEFLGKDTYSTHGSELLGKLASKYYFKEQDDNAWLSLSTENRLNADKDEYFDFPITNSSAMTVLRLLVNSSSAENYLMIEPSVRFFLISGGKDPIGLFGRGVLNTCEKLEANGIDVQMKLYPALRHEILNEDNYMSVYDDILKWINEAANGGNCFEKKFT